MSYRCSLIQPYHEQWALQLQNENNSPDYSENNYQVNDDIGDQNYVTHKYIDTSNNFHRKSYEKSPKKSSRQCDQLYSPNSYQSSDRDERSPRPSRDRSRKSQSPEISRRYSRPRSRFRSRSQSHSRSRSRMSYDSCHYYNNDRTRYSRKTERQEEVSIRPEARENMEDSIDSHRAFIMNHPHLEETWPSIQKAQTCFSNEEFSDQRGKYIKSHIKKKIGSIKRRNTQVSTSALHSSISDLPKLSVPIFNGEFSSWVPFKEMFTSLVINNSQLDDISKFFYLKQYTQGKANELISSLSPSGGFTLAWDELTRRYENKRILVFAQLDKIFNTLSDVRNAPSKSAQLSTLLNTIRNAVKSITLLGQSTHNWDCILIYLITKHMDSDTNKEWEETIRNIAEVPNFQTLVDFLTTQIRTLQVLETSSAHSLVFAKRKPKSRKRVSRWKQNSDIVENTTNDTCDYCNQNHIIVECIEFWKISPKHKLKIIHDKNLCFNCLGRHYAHSCNNEFTCNICGLQHHSALHGVISFEQNI